MHNIDTCQPETCGPKACCALYTGGCALLSPSDCRKFDSYFSSFDTTCSPNPCFAATGACCKPSGSCSVTQRQLCQDSGYRWIGPATTCTPEICCRADFDNSGTVAVQDIFDFLDAWFAGCN